MFECETVADVVGGHADPRLRHDYLRCLPGEGQVATVLVVGVVHDHPASVARVHRLLAALDPAVLALELPPLSVPLFELYATDDHVPPRLGGEMSAAIQQAPTARVVGIDGPDVAYGRRLLGRLRADRASPGLVRTVVGDFLASAGHALLTRVGAAVAQYTPLRPRLYDHIPHEVTLVDDPAAQADGERTLLARRRAFARAVETPPATALVDDVRNERMVARLRRLRLTGSVVAVVGMDHLDDVASGLERSPVTTTPK